MKATAPATPQEPPWHIRRRCELERQIHDLQVDLEEANRYLRVFRVENTRMLGIQKQYLSPTITGRQGLEEHENALVKKIDGLRQQHSDACTQLSELPGIVKPLVSAQPIARHR
jgi:hypothetical protein